MLSIGRRGFLLALGALGAAPLLRIRLFDSGRIGQALGVAIGMAIAARIAADMEALPYVQVIDGQYILTDPQADAYRRAHGLPRYPPTKFV